MSRLTVVLVASSLLACSGAVSTDDGGSGGGSTATGGGAATGGSGGSGGGSSGTGGGGGSTGTGGGAQVGDGGFYGEVRCSSGSYLVCDDFEGASISTTTWSVDRAGGSTVELDTSKFARGGKSLHTRSTGGNAYLELKAPKINLAQTTLWGRAFLFVPTSGKPATSPSGHDDFIKAHGMNSKSLALYAVSISEKSLLFSLYFQANPQIDIASFTQHPMPFTQLPVDRWFCLEWQWDGVNKRIAQSIDGVEQPSTVMEGYEAPGDVTLRIGPTGMVKEMWLDSVTLGTSRIGCAN